MLWFSQTWGNSLRGPSDLRFRSYSVRLRIYTGDRDRTSVTLVWLSNKINLRKRPIKRYRYRIEIKWAQRLYMVWSVKVPPARTGTWRAYLVFIGNVEFVRVGSWTGSRICSIIECLCPSCLGQTCEVCSHYTFTDASHSHEISIE